MNQKSVILDATTLSSLMSCARLTDLRYNRSLAPIGGKSNSLEVGSLVHKVLEGFYLSLASGKERAVAIAKGMELGQLYIKSCPFCTGFNEPGKPPCGHKVNEYPGMQNTPADSGKVDGREQIGYNYALDTCQQYFDHYKNDSWIPILVENTQSALLYEDEEIRILWKAKLDLTVDTNNGIYPVDHKTMKQRRDTMSLNNQFIGQCIVTKTRGVIINKIGFQSSLKPSEKFTRPLISYSLDRLTEWSQIIVPYYAKLMAVYDETGYWPPNFTHCENKYGFCSFKSVCEADMSMREEELRINFEIVPKWDISNDD